MFPAHAAVPAIAAGPVAASRTKSAPNIALASRSGDLPVMKALRCAAPARERIFAARISLGSGNGLATVICLPLKSPGQQPQEDDHQPGQWPTATWHLPPCVNDTRVSKIQGA